MACQCCGAAVEKSRSLHAHEEWSFDEAAKPPTVKLVGVKLLCWLCHMTEHYTLLGILIASGAVRKGARDDVKSHFKAVNELSADIFDDHYELARKVYSRRSALHFLVDWGDFEQLILEYYTHIPQPPKYTKNELGILRILAPPSPLREDWQDPITRKIKRSKAQSCNVRSVAV